MTETVIVYTARPQIGMAQRGAFNRTHDADVTAHGMSTGETAVRYAAASMSVFGGIGCAGLPEINQD